MPKVQQVHGTVIKKFQIQKASDYKTPKHRSPRHLHSRMHLPDLLPIGHCNRELQERDPRPFYDRSRYFPSYFHPLQKVNQA